MEFVYVVPRARIFRAAYPQGLVPFGEALSREDFLGQVREHGFFVERAVAERTPDWKQVIPYSVVTSEGHVLLMRRLGKGGEERLFDKLSIGVGGHINPEDCEDSTGTEPRSLTLVEPEGGAWMAGKSPRGDLRQDPVAAGTRREVTEELGISGECELRSVGILNDDSNAVGAVHVGLVQVLTVQGNVTIREREVLEGEMVRPADLLARLSQGANFETWSRILIERLDEVLPDLLSAGVGSVETEPACT